MAYTNLQTGEIKGCEKGSLTYFHEEGHLKFDNNKFGRVIRTIQEFSLDALIMFTAMGLLFEYWLIKVIILNLLILRISSITIEERDCWAYAKRKLNEVKDVRRRKREV